MADREFSDFSMTRVQCEHCDAVWINGVHTWQTGKQEAKSELDLAGLVCNTPHGDREKCINPAKGKEGGDTWEKRRALMEEMEQKLKDQGHFRN